MFLPAPFLGQISNDSFHTDPFCGGDGSFDPLFGHSVPPNPKLQKPDFMDPRHPLWHEVTDNGHYLVFEKPRHLSGYKLKGEKTCAKLCPRRWKEDMAGLIVLAPGPRAYVARQLHNVPHYEVTGYEMLRLRDMAKVVAKECSRFELLEVAYGDDIANNVSSLTDDFFHVR